MASVVHLKLSHGKADFDFDVYGTFIMTHSFYVPRSTGFLISVVHCRYNNPVSANKSNVLWFMYYEGIIDGCVIHVYNFT